MIGTIVTILLLYILLPTADIFTDIHMAVKLYKPPPDCKIHHPRSKTDRLIYKRCEEDPVTFCSKNENREHCVLSHYKMATVLMLPFLVNYVVCFYRLPLLPLIL